MNGVDPDTLKFDIVSDVQGFESLANDWADLGTRAASSTVFLQWEWHYTWWQIFSRRNDRLHILTWRDNGRLVGLLPLYIRHSSIPASNALYFIGTGGPSDDEVATEYSDLLADTSQERQVSSLAATHLCSFQGWQRIELICVLSDALLLDALHRNEPATLTTRSSGQRYRVSLDKDEEAWLSLMDPSRKKRIRRSQRALKREGGMSVRSPNDVPEFDRAFQDLSELNHERQVYKQRNGVFTPRRFREFHHQLCSRLISKGTARIVLHYVDVRLIAVLYCFYDEHSCYYYQSGFAAKDSNRLMPLTLAHLNEMQRSREAGLKFYDFMRGQPPCYKDDLACETTSLVNVSLYRTRVHHRLALGYRWVRRRAAASVRRIIKSS